MNYNSLKLHFNKKKLKSPNQAITFFFTPTNKPIQHPLYISTLIFEPWRFLCSKVLHVVGQSTLNLQKYWTLGKSHCSICIWDFKQNLETWRFLCSKVLHVVSQWTLNLQKYWTLGKSHCSICIWDFRQNLETWRFLCNKVSVCWLMSYSLCLSCCCSIHWYLKVLT
jgi:hypothetical protein